MSLRFFIALIGLCLTPTATASSLEGYVSACEQRIVAVNIEVLGSEADANAPQLNSIAPVCPELVEFLSDSGQSEILTKTNLDWNIDDLNGLLALQNHYLARTPRPALEQQTLQSVLDGLPQYNDQALSLWDRFKGWLRELLADSSGEMPAWLQNLSVPPTLSSWLLYGSTAAIIIIALVIIYIEVRNTRGRRPVAAERGRWQTGRESGESGLSLTEISKLPLQERPGAILGVIARSLQQAKITSKSAALTPRDISIALRQHTGTDQYAGLSVAAERATYGNWRPTDSDIAQLLDQGNNLLNFLRGAREPL
ncbi:MAG: hypothetical protein AAGF35_05615 [Pseudomonadota bacterium]